LKSDRLAKACQSGAYQMLLYQKTSIFGPTESDGGHSKFIGLAPTLPTRGQRDDRIPQNCCGVALQRIACQHYCSVGKVGFDLLGGQCSHTNELGVASTISSRLRLRRLNDIGREQVAHFGHGLYIAAPCAYCSRTQRAAFNVSSAPPAPHSAT
jgi:hypothetical protein